MQRSWQEALAGGLAGLVVLAAAAMAGRGVSAAVVPPTAAAVPVIPAPLHLGPGPRIIPVSGACAAAVSAAGSPAGQRASAAAMDAARSSLVALLQSLPAYPGATPMAPSPYGVGQIGGTAGAPGALPLPMTPDSPNLVDVYRLWRTSASPTAVLQWVQGWAAGQGLQAMGSGQSGGPSAADDVSSLQFSAGTAGDGTPQVEISASGAGLVRYDALVVVVPARPAGEVVPSGATAVEVTLCNGLPDHPTSQTDITAPAQVAALAAAVNELQVQAGGVFDCAADTGLRILLDFRYAGRPGVTVTDWPACAEVYLGPSGQWPVLSAGNLQQAITAATGWGTAVLFQGGAVVLTPAPSTGLPQAPAPAP